MKMYLTQRIFFTLLTGSLVFSCGRGGDEVSDLYPKDTMIRVLMDIHLAEARIEVTGYRNLDSARVDYKVLEKEVYEKYALDTARYNKTFAYYTDNVDFMQEVYTCIRDSFKRKDSLLKLVDKAPKGIPPAASDSSSRPGVNRKKATDTPPKSKN